MNREKQITQFTERFVKAFGSNAISLILYGSAAGAEFNEHYSDVNMLCVLGFLGPPELQASEPLFRWWREEGNPPPVLMTEKEVAGSTDCFPIEYQDLHERRRVLHGRDVVAGLAVDRSFYRAQVEYELRSKLLRLRRKVAMAIADPALLVRLLADSLSTFLVLGRHGLLLAGHPGGATRRETIALLREHFLLEEAPFAMLLRMREEPADRFRFEAQSLLTQYLIGLQQLVDAVDSLHK